MTLNPNPKPSGFLCEVVKFLTRLSFFYIGLSKYGSGGTARTISSYAKDEGSILFRNILCITIILAYPDRYSPEIPASRSRIQLLTPGISSHSSSFVKCPNTYTVNTCYIWLLGLVSVSLRIKKFFLIALAIQLFLMFLFYAIPASCLNVLLRLTVNFTISSYKLFET